MQQTPRVRLAAAIGGIALCAGLAWSGAVDSTVALSLGRRRLMLVVGLTLGTLLGRLVSYVTHHPMTRRAVSSWGLAGGLLVLVAAASTVTPEIAGHRRFLLASACEALAAALAVRMLVFAAVGPDLSASTFRLPPTAADIARSDVLRPTVSFAGDAAPLKAAREAASVAGGPTAAAERRLVRGVGTTGEQGAAQPGRARRSVT